MDDDTTGRMLVSVPMRTHAHLKRIAELRARQMGLHKPIPMGWIVAKLVAKELNLILSSLSAQEKPQNGGGK